MSKYLLIFIFAISQLVQAEEYLAERVFEGKKQALSCLEPERIIKASSAEQAFQIFKNPCCRKHPHSQIESLKIYPKSNPFQKTEFKCGPEAVTK